MVRAIIDRINIEAILGHCFIVGAQNCSHTCEAAGFEAERGHRADAAASNKEDPPFIEHVQC